jgi:hypothetical protein
MKIKSIAAVGAMSVGLGLASLVGGTGVASADCSTTDTSTTPPTPPLTPPLTPARVVCITNEQLSEFLRTASPQYNVDVFLNGQNETAGDPSTNNGLGILDQPQTFVNSLVGEQGFFNGPRSPDPAPESGSGF